MNSVNVQKFDRSEPGFHSALVFDSWKTAIFNYAPEWQEKNIHFLQKHMLTDEVFVLLQGECTLIISDENIPETMYGVRMEKGKIYNIPKGVWHSHVLSTGSKLIVVENSNTTPENSPKMPVPYPVDLHQLKYEDAVASK